MNLRRILTVTTLALAAGAAVAQNQFSDTLKITVPPPGAGLTVTMFDGPIGSNSPETAVFNLPPFPDGLLAGPLPTNVAPVAAAVALLEAPGAVPDPGSTPVFFNNRIVSDWVISFNGAAGKGVAFISEGDGNFAPWSSFLMSGATPPPIGIDETGAFQDLTSPLGTPFKVEVQSDVSAVPEPAAAALLLSGLAMLGCARLRRRP